MNIIESTRSFEAWLRRQITIVGKDLKSKHAAMEESPFVFLRATFYRWAQVWPERCSTLANAPTVLAVGDLHLENFGTWRDSEGRLVWGINDFDEAYPLPYTNDLVRLAASVFLARREGHFEITRRSICAAILDGYHAAVERGGRPVVLAERNAWLGAIAIRELRDPKRFWRELRGGDPATPPVPAAVLRRFLPAPRGPVTFLDRLAGKGSLGRKRCVAVADVAGARIAREAKAIVPSAAAWVDDDRSRRVYAAEAIRQAVRSPDPFLHVLDGWVVRRLAPDCVKIELGDLPRARDEPRLLAAMGWEIANVHLGGPKTAILRDLRARKGRWLERAAADMVDATVKDWRAWRNR
jgi:uncharacterized protein DUF2252